MFMLLIKISPEVGAVVPFKTFNKVDFPAPLAPIIPINFPDSSAKLIGCKPTAPDLNLYAISLASNKILDFIRSTLYLLIISP